MSDAAKAEALFRKAGLGFPKIPVPLVNALKEQERWVYSTRPLESSPYNLRHFMDEVRTAPGNDFAVLAHSGHGVNSYAIQYYLVHGSLRLFLFLGWGGVYTNNQHAADGISQCFDLADQIVVAADSLPAGLHLTVVASDFYGSAWSHQDEVRHLDSVGDKRPADVLMEALEWLVSGRLKQSASRNPSRPTGDNP